MNYDAFVKRLLAFVTTLSLMIMVPAMASFAPKREGIGGVAGHVMSPVTLFSDMIYTACLIIGASFVFASIIKYREHKRSPLMVPLSTVIFLLVSGLVLLSLPMMSYVYSGAVKYSFFS